MRFFFKITSCSFSATFLFCMSLAGAMAGKPEPIVMGYEYNIDQQVVNVFPLDKNEQRTIFLYKKYLEQRKSKVDIERSKTIVYYIRDTQGNKTVPFITLDFLEAHLIGKITKVSDGFLIPVIYNLNSAKIFKYTLSDQAVRSIELPDFSVKDGVLRQLFYIKEGYLAVNEIRDALKIVYQPYNSSNQTTLDFNNKKFRLSSVDDITEFNGRIYIVGSAFKEDGKNDNSIWLNSFDSRFSKESMQSFNIDVGSAVSQQAEFILTTHNYPSLQVMTRTSMYAPATVNIFKLDPLAKLIWRFDLSEIEGNRNAFVAGICADEYLFARKVRSKKTISDSIEFRIISSSGKERRAWIEAMVVNGSLLNVGNYPGTDYFFTITNFSKTEEIRRQDGWYSWLGFRIDKFDLQKECD